MAAAQAVCVLYEVASSCLGCGCISSSEEQRPGPWTAGTVHPVLGIIKILRNCPQDSDASSQESHSLAWSLLALGSLPFHLRLLHTLMLPVLPD